MGTDRHRSIIGSWFRWCTPSTRPGGSDTVPSGRKQLLFRKVRAGVAAEGGPETLEVATYVEGPAEGGARRAYVTLSNPGRFVPLYPLHRLRIAVTVGERPTRATGPRWLPLGMGRGSKWVERVDLPEVPGMVEVHGEVDGAGQTYRFALIPGGPTQHPLLVKGSRPAGAEPPAVRSGVVP